MRHARILAISALVILVSFFALNAAMANDLPHASAARGEGEDWREAAKRNGASAMSVFSLPTPESLARPLDQASADLANLPEWPGSIAGIRQAFELSRDERFYDDGKHDFLRRSSWMYPDDGCFARASHVAASLERAGLTRPGRVFAFGDLKMVTKFNSRGAVYWWYHVAAAYRSGNLVVVLDPSAHHHRPLLLHEWVALMSKRPNSTRIALCDTHAYMAAQACLGGGREQERSQVSHQKSYLRSEFTRLGRLGLDAERTLRENTSWGAPETYPLPSL